MNINYEIIDNMLKGLLETDDVSINCKEEIKKFITNHDMNVFSDENIKQLGGIWKLSMKPAYEAVTGQILPNIFVKKDF